MPQDIEREKTSRKKTSIFIFQSKIQSTVLITKFAVIGKGVNAG